MSARVSVLSAAYTTLQTSQDTSSGEHGRETEAVRGIERGGRELQPVDHAVRRHRLGGRPRPRLRDLARIERQGRAIGLDELVELEDRNFVQRRAGRSAVVQPALE